MRAALKSPARGPHHTVVAGHATLCRDIVAWGEQLALFSSIELPQGDVQSALAQGPFQTMENP